MLKVSPQDSWHDSWKKSYLFDLLEIYDDISHRGYAYAYDNRRKHTLGLVDKIAGPGAKILDVAAAQGNFSLSLAERGYEITWNDLRAELADYVELKREYGIIHYVPGNIYELAFDSYFDLILITEIIEHVAHPDNFLNKIAKMVKPGGHVILTTPNGEYCRYLLPKFSDCSDPSQFEKVQFKPDSDGHIFLLHTDEVEPLAQQASLKVVEIRLFNNPLTSGHLRLETLLHLIPRDWVHCIENLTANFPIKLQKKLHNSMAVLLTRTD